MFYNDQVIVCPSSNKAACVNNWNLPLIIFVDNNHNEIFDDNDILLRTHSKADDNTQWLFSAFPNNRYLSFNYDGSFNGNNGRLSYCVTQGKAVYSRQIIIAKTGRARRGDDDDALKKCG